MKVAKPFASQCRVPGTVAYFMSKVSREHPDAIEPKDLKDKSHDRISPRFSLLFTRFTYPKGRLVLVFYLLIWSCHLNLGSKFSSRFALSMLNSVSLSPAVGVYRIPGKHFFTSSSFFIRMQVSSAAIKYW